MYKSFINIKHLNRSHLYWGIDKASGDVVDIDEVTKRGLNCNCRCAACKGDFIARKGEKNKHHFAHQSNYVCVYANEIAIYLLARKMLGQLGTIELPAVPVKIGQRSELAKESWQASIGEVYYQCEPEQYPPLLVATLDNRPTRIILSFGKYYNTEDLEKLRREAKDSDWDCISIPLPRIKDKESINPAMLRNSLHGCVQDKSWIRNARADRWKQRLEEAAMKPPQTCPSSWGAAYDCPLHEQFREGKYYARPYDCETCSYNLATYPECKCLAFKGIQHLRDFKRPDEQLQAEVSDRRKANEERLRLIAIQQEQREKLRNFRKLNQHYSGQAAKPKPVQIPREEQLRIGTQEIADRFTAPTDEPVFDRFNRRWIKCTRCGEIKPSEIMADYGGRGKAHLGICRDCSITENEGK